MFKNVFSIEGRIRRSEYFLTFILSNFITLFIVGLTENSNDEDALYGLLLLPVLWILIAQGAKRCHDIGKSGWWQIVPFFSLWMIFQDSDPFTNSYGENPKGIKLITQSDLNRNNDQISQKQNEDQNRIINKNTANYSLLEVQNTSFSNLQELIKRIKLIRSVKNLDYKYVGTTGELNINHESNTQELLENIRLIEKNIQVVEVSQGKIIIIMK